jgi:tRNA(Ile)-lysidine synthetase-like protein
MRPGSDLTVTLGARLSLPDSPWTLVCHQVASEPRQKPGLLHLSAPLSPAGQVRLRTPCPGDTIVLAGGRKKVSDLLIDRKVPRAHRASVPLLVSDDAVLWVVGQARAAMPPGAAGTTWLQCAVEWSDTAS